MPEACLGLRDECGRGRGKSLGISDEGGVHGATVVGASGAGLEELLDEG